MPRLLTRIVIIALTYICAAAFPSLAEWSGQMVERDGVTHVLNPEQAVEEVTVTLKELWRVGGDDPDILIGMISQFVHDEEGKVYVLDGQLNEIHVFSPDGRPLATLGREGEGPGEFRGASDLFLGPGGVLGVVQVFPGKIVKLQRDGTPAGNFPLPEVEGGGFQLVFVGRGLNDRVVLAGAQTKMIDGKQNQVSYLRAFDANGKQMAEYHVEGTETQFGGMKFQEKTFSNFQRRWALAPDARVAAALDFDAYTVHVWKGDGTLDRVIERPDFKPVPRSAAHKKRFQRLYDGLTRWNPGSTFEINPTHVAVNGIAFRDDGTLWVQSSAGTYQRNPGIFTSYDVYDREGRYVSRIHLKGEGDPTEDGIFFVHDRLYVVTDLFSAALANFATTGDAEPDEEPEPVSIIAYQLDIPAVASNKK